MPFELFQSEKTGKYHIRLKATNGQIVLSGEACNQKSGAQNGIQSVIKNTTDGDSMFERKKSKNGSPYLHPGGQQFESVIAHN